MGGGRGVLTGPGLCNGAGRRGMGGPGPGTQAHLDACILARHQEGDEVSVLAPTVADSAQGLEHHLCPRSGGEGGICETLDARLRRGACWSVGHFGHALRFQVDGGRSRWWAGSHYGSEVWMRWAVLSPWPTLSISSSFSSARARLGNAVGIAGEWVCWGILKLSSESKTKEQRYV